MADETEPTPPMAMPAAVVAAELDTWGELASSVVATAPIAIPDESDDPHGYDLAMIALRKQAGWAGTFRATPPAPDALFSEAPTSIGVEPDRTAELVPADPRMARWRLFDQKRALTPERYLLHRNAHGSVYDDTLRWEWWPDSGEPAEPKLPDPFTGLGVDVYQARSGVWYLDGGQHMILWENPVTGDLRFCKARPLTPWIDPWAEDSSRIEAVIARRTTCICGAVEHKRHGLDVSCYCELPGWTYSDAFWTENIKPVDVPKRKRKLPAQFPMGTRRSRLRGWWWRVTHRRPEPVAAADSDDDDEEWV